MRVMVMVKASAGSEAGELPSPQLLADMGKFNEELVQAGIMKAGEGLKPTSAGVRVHFSGSERTVTDGPFAETKELVAGYWLWEVKSMQEAIEWVKRCPNPMNEDSDIEIRPLYEMEDFAQIDPEGKEARHEEALRVAIAAQSSVIEPYLFFDGRCAEALEFYQQALGAQVTMQMKFSDSPQPPPEGTLAPGFENKIMHASLMVGKTRVMASDGCGGESSSSTSSPERFRLSLSVPAEDDCRRIFEALSDGGTVDMPLEKTFFSPLFGTVTDKFGVGWMVMVPGESA